MVQILQMITSTAFSPTEIFESISPWQTFCGESASTWWILLNKASNVELCQWFETPRSSCDVTEMGLVLWWWLVGNLSLGFYPPSSWMPLAVACLWQLNAFAQISQSFQVMIYGLRVSHFCDITQLLRAERHIYASLVHHWFRLRLVASLVPSHYLNQCWYIVNWTLRGNLSEILIKIHAFSLMKMQVKCHLRNAGHFVSASVC